jgi:hypothetical protein
MARVLNNVKLTASQTGTPLSPEELRKING